MRVFIFGLSTGAVFTLSILMSNGFTPQVSMEDTQRAEIVCKGGRWVKINKYSIYCLDGAEYPRYEEKK